MSRAIGPRPPFAAGNAALAWVLIAAAWGLIALTWLAWAAARLAALAAGRGHVPPFGTRWASALVHGRTAQAWPGTPTPLVAVTGGILAVAAGRRHGHRLAPHRPEHDQARRPGRRAQPGPVHPPAGAVSGRRAGHPAAPVAGRGPARQPGPRRHRAGTRPPQAARRERPGPVRLLGRHRARVHGPRVSGKTTALGIPYVLSAPGAVIATSNKADLWAATAELARRPGLGACGCSTRSASPPPGSAGGGTRWPG